MLTATEIKVRENEKELRKREIKFLCIERNRLQDRRDFIAYQLLTEEREDARKIIKERMNMFAEEIKYLNRKIDHLVSIANNIYLP